MVLSYSMFSHFADAFFPPKVRLTTISSTQSQIGVATIDSVAQPTFLREPEHNVWRRNEQQLTERESERTQEEER